MRIATPALVLALVACGTGAPETDPGGEDATVRAPAAGDTALTGARWMLAEVGGTPARSAEPDRAPYLELSAAEGRASGNGSCNRFSGPYTLQGDSLTFGPLVSTKMACIDDALTAQEAAFLGALEQTRRWRLVGDTLVLSGAEGDLARLTRAAGPQG